MSPILNSFLNSFRVQSISLKLIVPLSSFCVLMTVSNLSILVTTANSHPKDFSKFKSLRSFFQFLYFFIFDRGPLHPFLLSNSCKPFLSDCVAIFCNSKSKGVLMLNPCLYTLSYPYLSITSFLTSST